jgi:signal peptidase I
MARVEHKKDSILYDFHKHDGGEIDLFNSPVDNASKPYIKRVIGLPGETVEIHDDHVFIDGQQLDEPYLKGAATFCAGGRDCPPVTVPAGHVFVMGDNRDNSSDSRAFGVVDIDSIIGKAWITYWPFDAAGLVPHYDYPEIRDGH